MPKLSEFEVKHARQWAEGAYGDPDVADAFVEWLEGLDEEDLQFVRENGYVGIRDQFEEEAAATIHG